MKGMFRFVAVAVAAFMMAACGNETEYTQASKGNMIPDNAVAAMKVDATQLWDKALGAEDSEMRLLWDVYKASIPALGINMDEPVVVSVAADIQDVKTEQAEAEVYFVALLDDPKVFVNAVDRANKDEELGLTKEVIDEVYTYYSCTPDVDMTVDMGVADKSVTLRFKYSSLSKENDNKASMLNLYANGGPEKTEGLDAFYASKGDVAMWMDFEDLMNMIIPIAEETDPSSVKMIKEYMPMLKNASAVTDLAFEDGKTVLQMQMFGSEQMKAYAQKYNAPATSKFLHDIPFSPVFAVNVAMKDFAGMIKDMRARDEQLEDVFDDLESEYGFDKELMEGFPGLITFALDGNGLGERKVPGVLLQMEFEENVWVYIEQYLQQYGEEVEDNIYCIEDEFVVGYEDGILVAGDIYSFISEPFEFDFAESYLGDAISEGGMAFDLKQLPEEVLDELAEEFDSTLTVEELLEFFDSVVFSASPDHMSAAITLYMGDTSENLLGKLVQYFVTDSLAGSLPMGLF